MKIVMKAMPAAEAITPERIESRPSEAPDRQLLQVAQGRGQRARAQDLGELVRLLGA